MHDALPAFATVAQLEVRLAVQLTDGDAAQAQMLLEAASNLIRGETGRDWVDDDGNLTATPVTAAKLRTIVLEMVKRAVSNPEGAVQQTAGPFNVSFGSVAAENLWLTKLERRALARLGRGGLWVQPVTRGPVETPTVPDHRRAVSDADSVL